MYPIHTYKTNWYKKKPQEVEESVRAKREGM